MGLVPRGRGGILLRPMTAMGPISEDRIRTVIRVWLCEAFRDGRQEGLSAETPLVTSGLVDSAGVLEVVAFLERRFSVRIEDEDVNVRNFDSVAGLAALVAARLRTRGDSKARTEGSGASGFRGRNGAAGR